MASLSPAAGRRQHANASMHCSVLSGSMAVVANAEWAIYSLLGAGEHVALQAWLNATDPGVERQFTLAGNAPLAAGCRVSARAWIVTVELS